MKKLKLLMIPFLVILLSMNTLALNIGGGTYEFADENKVVSFEETSMLSVEQQQMVAERLVYGAPEDDGVSTYAWCWLTGHDLTYDTVLVITHKVYPDSPRCYEETYHVETCTKCDHMSEELVGGVYIVCCPEE